MTVTIELPSDIEADLVARLGRRALICPSTSSICSANRFPRGRDPPFHRRSRPSRGVNRPSGLPHTPPLSDDAISRESIYGDRGR